MNTIGLVIMIIVFLLLGTAMVLISKYCKKKPVKIALEIFVVLVALYAVVFCVDCNRVASMKKPIFAIENGYMGSMTRYDGLGYRIGLEIDASTGHISQSQMTMFGIFVTGAIE